MSQTMSQQQLVDELIATYRELNSKVRRLPEARLTLKGADGISVRDVVIRLRDEELRFSQALKERLTGVEMPDFGAGQERPIVGTESSTDSTSAIIAQFGTARESTLTLLRGLTEEEWIHPADGGKPLEGPVRQLVEHDRRQMERIIGLLGAP